jgi:hypothetical protein
MALFSLQEQDLHSGGMYGCVPQTSFVLACVWAVVLSACISKFVRDVPKSAT